MSYQEKVEKDKNNSDNQFNQAVKEYLESNKGKKKIVRITEKVSKKLKENKEKYLA